MIRLPAVAGLFYASEPEALRAEIESCFYHPLGPWEEGERFKAKGEREKPGNGQWAVETDAQSEHHLTTPLPHHQPFQSPTPNPQRLFLVPHAGHVYSGACAAHVYAQLIGSTRTVILLGPDHRGRGYPFALYEGEGFQTPLGVMPIDQTMVEKLRHTLPILRFDNAAHAEEHSLEVQIPFLQFACPSASIVPILFGVHPMDDAYDTVLKTIGSGLGEAIQDQETVVIVTTDLSHYLPIEHAYEMDQRAINALLTADPSILLSTVRKYAITMCGAVPAAVGLHLAQSLGMTECRLLQYYTSGDLPAGDQRRVVGYAAFTLEGSRFREQIRNSAHSPIGDLQSDA